MDADKLNSLKKKGNKAYVDGKYDEAIDFYQEALDLVGLEDKKTAAVLHSNISQAYLKKKYYPSAVESATKSLKLHPSFRKSNLRRAIANTELGNYVDAMKDLQLILSFEPDNKAAKNLMRRCSNKPKMKLELHEVYAKYYVRSTLKKTRAQIKGGQSEILSANFRYGLMRQSLLSTNGLVIANHFFRGTSVVFDSDQNACLNFAGWVTCQFMWFKCVCFPVSIKLSDKLFKLLYYVLRPETFSLAIEEASLCVKTLLSNKYSEVYLLKERALFKSVAVENDLNIMNNCSDHMNRLVYHSGLANFKETRFPKAKSLAFRIDDFITINFLKLWKKNKWLIESLFFVHGAPDFRALKQFKQSDGFISSKVNSVFIRFARQNHEVNKMVYKEVCDDLPTLRSVFPKLNEVTITHRFVAEIKLFPRFAKDLNLIRIMLDTISTKPEWCTKLKGVIFVEFIIKSYTEAKIFDVKLLEQSAELLHQDHPDMKLRLCGPRSYDNLWTMTPCVHAVIEFENKVAQFELAICYNHQLNSF